MESRHYVLWQKCKNKSDFVEVVNFAILSSPPGLIRPRCGNVSNDEATQYAGYISCTVCIL